MAIAASTRIRLERQLDALPVILDEANARFAEIRPDDGGWSARENVVHLARHAHVFLERMARIIQEDTPDLGTYRPELDAEWSSWRSLPLDEALRRLRSTRARLLTWVDGLTDGQTRRVGIHPVLGPMDAGRWLEFFLLHEAHHLYSVMRRLGQASRQSGRAGGAQPHATRGEGGDPRPMTPVGGQMMGDYLSVNGARLYFEVAGTGHPLVLIHAGVADCRMWDEQFSVVAQHYRVIRYDTRGFGKSKTEDVEFSNCQDLFDLLEHLGVEHACLVGASRAGGIAIDFTLEHPEKVAALILVGSGLGGLDHKPLEHEKQMFDEMDEAWNQKDFARLAALELTMWVDGPGQSETRVEASLRERVRDMILNTYNTHTTEGKPRRLDPPAAKRLAEISASTLIIVGDLDESGVLAAGEVLERGIRAARKVVMAGTAHLPSMERPAEFNRIVLDFIHDAARRTST